MTESKSRFVVSADWLQAELGKPDLRVLDASFYLPVQKRDADAEYAAGHIPGAIRFDQDKIADHSASLPHTIPSPDYFAAEVGRLGISENDRIVVYDGIGLFASPRVWWLFRVMGAKNVFVLDGGLDGWKAEGRPLETTTASHAPTTFTPNFDSSRVVTLDAMRDIVSSGAMQIADARSAGRFAATEPEPRAGMRSGHMPGARSLPSGVFASRGRFKSLPELRQTIEDAGIDLSKPVVTSCGSGITAAIITLALESLGHQDNKLYDGSWSEWGSRDDTPVVIGPPTPVKA
ncbi:3-mercaptopyruvate sulfurtransferase [Rhizobium binae]|uniref:Thiosulfate/3-mercaptopyruvate sulfurtransferase n=1 Tax=Rhizobium binae TaxID=1138190 RepID=A0ABV2MES0_9HYPH|nr:3-mercaptopyruvate sulfurtransferase [Rhizobium binae]NKL47434.1 3-mercaptopyruvate sulfurtransferase [Rhizobium leguminosarum bv. viciae]MBX4927341.1 3-mercaptopyruvate sulfurtransferase [Rhizobium binae]MBX4940858.1 3-mercaptopyruvate sulfurtransferase [Rhizobium binae]MBX4942264.1 3-mercaptopyruvate sulfurtransferase [Rhizobium binae]MBX4949568.1 3-mercaptopyruvate sulfurtransferase [Rhizobium binae]